VIHSARRDNTRATELACSFPFNQKCSDCKISEPFDVNKKRGRNLAGCKFQGRPHWEMKETAKKIGAIQYVLMQNLIYIAIRK